MTAEDISKSFYTLTDEAESFLINGSPEIRVFNAVPEHGDGISRDKLVQLLGADVVKVGQGACMKNKWIKLDKTTGSFSRCVS